MLQPPLPPVAVVAAGAEPGVGVHRQIMRLETGIVFQFHSQDPAHQFGVLQHQCPSRIEQNRFHCHYLSPGRLSSGSP